MMVTYRVGLGIGIGPLVVLLVSSVAACGSVPAQASAKEKQVVRVSVNDLDVDEATVTVSVLEDPLEPMRSALELCQSGVRSEEGPGASEVPENLRTLCRTIERLTEGFDAASHELEARDYLVTIPLKIRQGTLEMVTWKSYSLDDAIMFVELLQTGKLKAVTVHRKQPGSSEGPSCTECPIKDLVFSAAGIKEAFKHDRRDEREGR